MSGRIRSLKPEWLEDEPLVACSSDARVLSAALLLLADDYGNGRAGELYLASRVFPGKSPEILRNALEELTRMRYVVLYEVDGQRYFHVRNWAKHQRVQHPGKPIVPQYEASHETVKEHSGEPPESLAPDRDRRPGPTTNDQRPTRGSRDVARAVVGDSPVESAEPDDPGRELPCPVDLAERLEKAGTPQRLAEKLAVPIESIRHEIQQFVSYWVLGKGMGQKRTGWPGKARQWVVDQHGKPGGLKPPGAVKHAHGQDNGDYQPSAAAVSMLGAGLLQRRV